MIGTGLVRAEMPLLLLLISHQSPITIHSRAPDAWRLRSNYAMSSTFTFSPPSVPAMPSVIMFQQNGQAVASVRAPVAIASCERKTETRCDGASSNHIPAPPAPQQKLFLPQRALSRDCAS